MTDASIKITGDTALAITFPGDITVANNLKVRALKYALEQKQVNGIVELVPTYCSLMVHYNPLILIYPALVETIYQVLHHLNQVKLPFGTVTEIPVLYGGTYGMDLEEVAAYEQITSEEVIRRHSGQECFIYMIAFAPGLPYIGSTQKTFSIPRRNAPRLKLPMGSVTIWQSQTTVFPVEQPGGWNVIGRTPLCLFDRTQKEHPFLLQSGHWVKFRPIDQAEYDRIAEQVQAGTYQNIIYDKRDV